MTAPQEPNATETRPTRRLLILGVLAAAVLAGASYGYRKWTYAQGHETTDNAQVDGHIVPVLAKVGGYVKAVRVAENDTVKAGAVLVELDDSELRQRLAQADAELLAAIAMAGDRGRQGQAQAQVQTASNTRASLEAQVTAARATATRAAADLARAEDLAAKQIISRQQLDGLRATAQAAQATVTALESQAGAAGAGITGAEAGVRLAKARVEAARAARDFAALQLSYAAVSAPEGGMVARKSVEVGQLVQPGQPLMTVVGSGDVWVTANLKETQLAHTRVGQPVEIHIDAYEGCVARGTVESIASATGAKFALLPPDNATGNFTKVVQRVPVRIRVAQGCGTAQPLRPGMSVAVAITTG